MSDKCTRSSIGGLSMKGNCKSDGTKSRENIAEYLRDPSVHQAIIWSEGSPGGSNYENLELELAKSFNSNRREIRVQEYRPMSKRS